MDQPASPRALITGASSGIGEAFARRLARGAHDLVLVARRKDRLDRLAVELSAERGVTAEVIAADLTADAGVSLVEERLRSGDVDLLVNNAGFGTIGEFTQLSLEREIEELDLNVRALMRLTHAAMKAMVPRGQGAIINVASTAAFQPIPYNATYSATKAFVLHFSEALHQEAKAQGVTVTCLCPGPVRTEFQQAAGIDERSLPSMVWMDADAVVESALSASRRGRAIVVPGALNTAAATGTRFLPRFLVRRLAAAVFRQRGSTDGST